MKPLLSVCLICKNEARDLPRALASVRFVADEVIVVDTGSSDGTPELAAEHGARVLHTAWEDDFSAARNVGLAEARGEWILVLDADEELHEDSAWALRPYLEDCAADGVRTVVRNLTPPGDLVAFNDVRITRLFRSDPAHRFEGRIHEQVGASVLAHGGTVVDGPICVVHHGYADVAATRGRIARNLALLEAALVADPGDPYLHYHHGLTLFAAKRYAEAETALRTAVERGIRHLSPDVQERTWTRLAQAALERGDYATATASAKTALRLAPGRTLPSFVQLVSQVSAGRMEGVPALLETLSAAPDLGPEPAAQVAALSAALVVA